MSLNIKNPEAHRLAQELASMTGESMATAVTRSLKERIVRLKSDQAPRLAERMLAIGRDCAARLSEPYRSVQPEDLFYDDKGLPK